MRRSTPAKQNLLTSGEKDEQLRRMMLFRALSTNILSTRQAYGGTQTFSGLRDIYSALGYPTLDQIKFTDYWQRYKRQDIAGRIVDAPVEGAWARSPIINSEDDSDKFKDAWEELEERLGIYSTLIRADILSGIGQYGVILLGLNDGSDNFAQPAEAAKELLYLQPFHQDNATIKSYDIDRYSVRYGQPASYSLQLANLPGMTSQVAIDVHHSRILHLADNLLESNVLGTPRLEKSYNNLIGLEMVVGASPEMFWQGAFPGMAFKAQEDFDITPEIKLQLDDEITKYVHQMERYMKLQGLDIQQLAPNIASPKDVSDLLIKMISISTKIPKRILEGSERGELSSIQDAEEWNSRCDLRRKNYVAPYILRKLIKRLGELRILEVPKKYSIEWPDLSTPSDSDQAATGKVRTEAIAKYAATPEAQLIVPIKEYLSDILQLPMEVVQRVMNAGDAERAKAMAEEADVEQQRQDDIVKLGYDPNDPNDKALLNESEFSDYNNKVCHVPAGSSAGGQFTGCGSSGTVKKTEKSALIDGVKNSFPDSKNKSYIMGALDKIGKKGYEVVVRKNEHGIVDAAAAFTKGKDLLNVDVLGSMGKGGGSDMIKAVVQASRQNGTGGAISLTPERNPGAIRLYMKTGFDVKPGTGGSKFWLSSSEATKMGF